jgi:hypothetical protein
MSLAIRAAGSASMAAGVAASANRRAAAGPVVVSCVRSERMQATRTRKGSPVVSASSESAVGCQRGRVRRSRRMTSAIATCP